MKRLVIALLIAALLGCSSKKEERIIKRSHPRHPYNHVQVDRLLLSHIQTEYVPVYSDIYFRDATRVFQLTTTISIRNTSPTDSAYILSATYYDSYGATIKEYANTTILISPLESIEFVVEEVEEIGGVGANFIIEWGADNYSDQLLIQSIMIGTEGQQGISFLSESKTISTMKR